MRRLERASSILAACALALAAAWPPVAGGAQPYSEWVHYRRLDVPAPWGTQRVLVTFPRRGDRLEHPPGERYPLLIALHGRGESRDPERAHLGWANLYRLPDAFAALLRGRVSVSDYNRFVRDTHLEYVNASLRARPFVGVMVVTPYVPDIAGEPLGSERMRALGEWLSGPLLDAVRARFEGAGRTREGTGIDGVSMGGRVALEVGLGHPGVFGAVGAIQPAIGGNEEALADLALSGAREVAPQQLRLLTSEDDTFLWATRRLSTALAERRLTHTLTIMPGPHDYAFNRGPGGIEMLLFHDRALAREPLAEAGR